MAHEAAQKLAQQEGAEVHRRYPCEDAWARILASQWHKGNSYAVIAPERTIVSGGTGISDADLISAAESVLDYAWMDVINHRGEIIESYGSVTVDSPAPRFTDPYADLRRILDDALRQASEGKGAERHGNGLSFDRQPMQTLSDQLQSPDGMAFQAMKKIREARGLPTLEAKRRELLGAINYVAGMVLWYERNEGGNDE